MLKSVDNSTLLTYEMQPRVFAQWNFTTPRNYNNINCSVNMPDVEWKIKYK